jgi:NAD(P)-dependent dehydrogenase (short-subunit alcohol dehydrogenase family)
MADGSTQGVQGSVPAGAVGGDLAGRVILITGATGNLGSACAVELARRGARLVLTDRVSEKLVGLARDLPPAGHVVVSGIDVSSTGACAALVREAEERAGPIDAAVHTVGAYRASAGIASEDEAMWDMMMAANVRTAMAICRAVAPGMLARGRGSIVAVASRHGVRCPAGHAAYGASKAALLRLIESIAEEARGRGVRAHCVVPGTLRTPQNIAAQPGADASKWVEPSSVAGVIGFLCSSAARDVTGAAIGVGSE